MGWRCNCRTKLKKTFTKIISKSHDNINDLIIESNSQASKIKGPVEFRTDIGQFKLSYNDCGVSISNGNLSVEKMKESVKSTYNERVIHKFGDYSGLLNGNNLENDLVLVGSIFFNDINIKLIKSNTI